MKRLFILLLVVLPNIVLFAPNKALAVDNCKCRVIVRKEDSAEPAAPACDYSAFQTLPIGTPFFVKDIINNIPLSDCAAKDFVAGFADSTTPVPLGNDGSCTGIDLNEMVQGYSVFMGGCTVESVVAPASTPAPTPATPVAPKVKKDDSIKLINPIGGSIDSPAGITDPNQIVGKIIAAAMGVLGSIALIVFMYGGFLWLTSRGNSEMITSGLDAMLYAGIGLFIIFASYAILNTIFSGLR